MTPATLRFSMLFLIALAFGSLALAARARAENGMEWQFSETNDPGNQDADRALIYGVPETDNVQVSGALRAQLERGRKFLHRHLRRRYRRSPERQGYRAARVGRWLRSRAQGQDLSRHRRGRCERRAGGYRQRRSAVAGFCREGLGRLFGARLQGLIARPDKGPRQDPAIRQGLRDLRRRERAGGKRCEEAATPKRTPSTAPRSSARSRPGRLSSRIIRQAFVPISPRPISRSSDRASRPTCLRRPMSARQSSCRTRRAGTAATSARKCPPRRPS